jgi:predicted nucleic acid-binding protein
VIFFDTNVLVYFSINQDVRKQEIADRLLLSAIETHSIVISPLVFTEYIFVLAKLNQIKYQQNNITFFKEFATGNINTQLIFTAYELGSELDICKNINDVIHLKFAEQHCNKLITFDSDFENLKSHTQLEIEIVN